MKSFLGKKILFITAHPDDESYLAAGTLFRNYKKGGQNFIICATQGEKGKSHLPKPISQKKLAEKRKREFFAASRFLRITKPAVLNLPDGKLRAHQAAFFIASLAFAKRISPDAIIGFGPDGITGHLDHIAAGKVAVRVARALKVPYYAFSLPPTVVKTAKTWIAGRRKSPHYMSINKLRFRKPTVRIAITAQIKKRAIRYHASQLDGRWAFTGFPPYVTRALLKAEYFVRR